MADSQTTNSNGYALGKVRLSLYILWLVLLLAYLGLFVACRVNGFPKRDVDDGIRQVLSLLVPILAAFLAFWLADPAPSDPKLDDDKKSGTIVFVVFSATLVGNFIVLGYLALGFHSLEADPANFEEGFVGVYRQGFTYLVMVQTFVTAPVAYVLRRPVSLGSVASEPRLEVATTSK